MPMNSSMLILAYVFILLLVKPVYPANNKDCDWCVLSDEKSCSEATPCSEVIDDAYEGFGNKDKSECIEIHDFKLKQVYGNYTRENVSVQHACSANLPASELGFALEWKVEGDQMKNMKQFIITLSKIYITIECVRMDTVMITKPNLTESASDKQVLFRYVYKGSEDYFCIQYGGSYSVSVKSGPGCVSSKKSTMFPKKVCPKPPKESPVGNSDSTTVICVVVFAIIVPLALIGSGIVFIKTKRRRKNMDCKSDESLLFLLNPQITEGQMMERTNTIATKISRLPGFKVDCNFWNRGQSQYDWVNNALQKVDIVIIVCIEDRTKEPTTENFDVWVSRLLTGNFSREVVILHLPDVHDRDSCPFNRAHYRVIKINGDAEKDTEALRKQICKITKGKTTRRETRPLIAESEECIYSSVV